MTGIMKAQIDWIPLNSGAVRPTQGKTLAVMQVSGGSQSFNAVNQMRLLGRWMRMLTIPNQSSVAKAFQEFDEAGRMKSSSYYERVVDVMEELVKFTLLTRDLVPYLTDRYSERVESAAELSARVNLPAAAAVAEPAKGLVGAPRTVVRRRHNKPIKIELSICANGPETKSRFEFATAAVDCEAELSQRHGVSGF